MLADCDSPGIATKETFRLIAGLPEGPNCHLMRYEIGG